MIDSQKQPLIVIYLKEYEKLKDEQTARIGFRDNLIYVTLVALGGIISFAISNPANYFALLVSPLVSIVLGWTYLANDEKISAIGLYIRVTLAQQIQELIKIHNLSFFGWEKAHRGDEKKLIRKFMQLIVDETTFVGSGFICILTFWQLVPNAPIVTQWIIISESILLVALGLIILLYADFMRG